MYINSSLLKNAHIQAKFWTRLYSITGYIQPLAEIHLNIDNDADNIYECVCVRVCIHLDTNKKFYINNLSLVKLQHYNLTQCSVANIRVSHSSWRSLMEDCKPALSWTIFMEQCHTVLLHQHGSLPLS